MKVLSLDKYQVTTNVFQAMHGFLCPFGFQHARPAFGIGWTNFQKSFDALGNNLLLVRKAPGLAAPSQVSLAQKDISFMLGAGNWIAKLQKSNELDQFSSGHVSNPATAKVSSEVRPGGSTRGFCHDSLFFKSVHQL